MEPLTEELEKEVIEEEVEEIENVDKVQKVLKDKYDFNRHSRKHYKRLGDMERKVAKLRAKGDTLAEIGQQVGRSRMRVQQICARDDIKALIEQEQARLATLVPAAVRNFQHYIENAIDAEDKTDKEISFRATQKLLESTGILNNQPSHLVQILYNDNKTIVSPVIQHLLDKFMDGFKDTEAIDAEYEDVKEIGTVSEE